MHQPTRAITNGPVPAERAGAGMMRRLVGVLLLALAALASPALASRSFNGTGDGIHWGDIAALDSLTKLTVNFWLNPTTLADYQGWVGKGDGGTNGWAVSSGGAGVGDNGEVTVTFRNASSNFAHTTDVNLVTGTWYNIHAVYDGAQGVANDRAKIWVNGVAKTLTHSGTHPASLPNLTQVMVTGPTNFAGHLAEVALWAGEAITDTAIISALAGGQPAIYYLSTGLDFYAPLWGVVEDLRALGTPTVTGTTRTAAPPLAWPKLPQVERGRSSGRGLGRGM